MSYAERNPDGTVFERVRDNLGPRATGVVAALLLEALLLLLLLTLSQSKEPPKPLGSVVTAFDSRPEAEPEPPQDERQEPRAEPTPVPQPPEPLPTPPPPEQTPRPTPLLRNLPRSFDLTQVPQAPAPQQPAPPAYGPQGAAGFPGDSQRVGTAPNGEPLYAAEWYRRPDRRMLGDYLSTAQGPGYGLIACRTVPEWRVEDCVAIGEYPERSNIARAVLAAAWEFRVRPPRIRGRYLYGEWVRIRIDYEVKRGGDFVPPN